VLGTDSFTDQVVTPIVQAGIPYVNSAASGNAENTLPGAFNLSGGTPSNLAAIAQYAKDKGWTRASIIALNVAAATASVNGPGKQAFDKAGISFNSQFLPSTQADLTSAVVQAMSSKPQMLVVAGGDVMCLAVARAVESLNADVQLIFASNSCLGKTLDEGAPPAVWTKTLVASGGTVSDDADSKAYTAAMTQYAKDVALGGSALRGYVGMLGLVRAANANKVTEPTAANLLAAMKTAKAVPLPLGGGNTFTCDGSAVPSLPAICSAQELLLQPDGKGAYSVAARADGAALMQ
jgi:branched-chain amino acid transport system substrate-binding protein